MTINAYAEPPFNVWRKLGFGYAHLSPREDDDTEDGRFAVGEMVTNNHIFLDWKDRLRLIISGKLHVQTRTQTDVIVRCARSRSAARVLSPFDRP